MVKVVSLSQEVSGVTQNQCDLRLSGVGEFYKM